MSLSKSKLQNDVLSVLKNMTDGDDMYFARELSAKIADYAESGMITTTDSGSISAGTFSGAGTGSIKVDSSICQGIVFAACQAMLALTAGGNALLAAQLALGVDSMMSAGAVTTTVIGTVISPVGVPSGMGGTAKGTFKGTSAILQSGFMAAFSAMDSMTSGGDEYLAGEIASAVTDYLTAGTITTNGQGSISGSVGTGSMS